MESEAERLSRVEAIVSGEVQYTDYRFMVQGIARKLAVEGYVQYMPDGTAKVVAEAPQHVLEAFTKKLEMRAPPVNVEGVELTYLKPTGEFEFFKIKCGSFLEEWVEGVGMMVNYAHFWCSETKKVATS